MTEEIMTMSLRIEGRVQAVGFREFVIREANERNLRGWVRNRADGSVEALVSGPKTDVEAVIAQCCRGPQAAQVSHIDMSPAEPPDNLGFTRRATV
jgi:acylphosphatase